MIKHAMQDNDNVQISSVISHRKLLQITNSSSTTFDTSQPAFIALLCIISILTCALVIVTSFLCYRYYSHRERRFRPKLKQSDRIFPPEPNPPSNIPPVSITPTSASSYSFRSSDQLVSSHHQQQRSASIDTIPSRRLQQSLLDAYLNDLSTHQPTVMDVRQLNNFLFVDLHSTSSETYPETISKSHIQHPIKSRSTLIQNSRFVMRERSLPTKLTKLPQLRSIRTQQEKDLFGFDDSNNSSTINRNHELLSTTTATTTDDYDDSHAYNVNKHQVLQAIKEEQPFFTEPRFPSVSLRREQEPYFFEIVSTTRDDASEIQFPYPHNNHFTYMNDSIIV